MNFLDSIVGISSTNKASVEQTKGGQYIRYKFDERLVHVPTNFFRVKTIDYCGTSFVEIGDPDSGRGVTCSKGIYLEVLSALRDILKKRVYEPSKYNFKQREKIEKMFCPDKYYKEEMTKARKVLGLQYITGSSKNLKLLEDITVNAINRYLNEERIQ